MKTYFTFSCIYCGQHVECEPRLCGRHLRCPRCLHRIAIPLVAQQKPTGQVFKSPPTWDAWVPEPSVEIPTRY